MPDTAPYPPGPDPETLSLRLTAIPRAVRRQETLLLAGLLLFLTVWLAVLGACLFGAVWLALHIGDGDTQTVIAFGLGIAIALGVIIYLLRGLFRRNAVALPTPAIEITADEQPGFFAFLRRVADDAGADFPRKVFLCADVNAAVVPQVRLTSLVKPPAHDLYIGLGLVNAVTVSELQAVLAHEFGHIGHRGPFASWAGGIETFVERFLAGPRLLQLFHRALTATKSQLIRGREFHADRVAASVAGSNAMVDALMKVQAGGEAWSRAVADAQLAAESHYFTADVYYHQHAAADRLRSAKPEDDDGDFHPGFDERERNLREEWVPANLDKRTPWLLFQDANALRRRMTAAILRAWPTVPANAALTEPRAVQAFLDAERNDVTFDAKHQGAYDDGRDLALQLKEMNDFFALTRNESWSEDRLRQVMAKAYLEIPERSARRAEVAAMRRRHIERPTHDDARHALHRLRDLDDRLERFDAWFHGFDRRVALVHWQMAAQIGEPRLTDLMDRYRFHLTLQDLSMTAAKHADLVRLHSRLAPRDDPYIFAELVAALRTAQRALVQLLRSAKDVDLPAMKHFAEAEQLCKYLLDASPVDDLPAGPLKEAWIRKLQWQLDRVWARAARLQAKSLIALLGVQDQIQADYHQAVAV